MEQAPISKAVDHALQRVKAEMRQKALAAADHTWQLMLLASSDETQRELVYLVHDLMILWSTEIGKEESQDAD